MKKFFCGMLSLALLAGSTGIVFAAPAEPAVVQSYSSAYKNIVFGSSVYYITDSNTIIKVNKNNETELIRSQEQIDGIFQSDNVLYLIVNDGKENYTKVLERASAEENEAYKELNAVNGDDEASSLSLYETNESTIYNFLKSNLGFNTAAACGTLANIYKESSFNPTASVVDTNGLTSYGICQWNGPRFTNLKNYCSQNGYSYSSLTGQLNFLKYELNNGYKTQYNTMKGYPDTSQGAYDAGYYWASKFEVCASQYWAGRGDLAVTYWNKYKPDPIRTDLPTPMYGYTASPSVKTTVYQTSSSVGGASYGTIFVDDYCTISAVDLTKGVAEVTYPVTGGGTKTGYVYLNEFIPTSTKLSSFYKTSVTKETTAYRKSDMSTKLGSVYVTDEIVVVGKSGNKLQIYYPLDSGGYKLGWIYNDNIKKTLKGISVTSKPSKQTYNEGESLNNSGLVITATYDDGSTANVTSSCTFTGYSSTPGTKTVTASYGGFTASYSVTVTAKQLQSINIVTNPTKTVYDLGETVQLSGLSVQAVYNNGTKETVTGYSTNISSDLTGTEGTKTITVRYTYNGTEKTASFNITVNAPAYKTGDVNSDGDVDFADAIMVLQADAGLLKLNNTQKLAADVNGDGEVDFADAVKILQIDAGL